MKRTFYHYLDDIMAATEAVEAFTQGMTKDEFVADLKTIYASRKAIEIIGEAAKKVPTSFKEKHQEIPIRTSCRSFYPMTGGSFSVC